MESPPPLPAYMQQKSKKRMFSGSSGSGSGSSGSAYVEPEVVEIAPPKTQRSSSKSLKQKEVIFHEVIDIDVDEDSSDVMIIDEKVGMSYKGKPIINVSDGFCNNQEEEAFADCLLASSSMPYTGSMDGAQSSKSFAPVSHNSNPDSFSSDLSFDDEHIGIYSDDFMDVDEYAMLQAHFDSMDIPPGIEAPIPWSYCLDFTPSKQKAVSNSSHLSFQSQLHAVDFPHRSDLYSSSWLKEPAQLKEMTTSALTSSQTQMDAVIYPPPVEPSLPWFNPEAFKSKRKPAALSDVSNTTSSSQTNGGVPNASGVEHLERKKKQAATASSSSNYHYSKAKKKLEGIKLFRDEPSKWGSFISNRLKKHVGFCTKMDGVSVPPLLGPSNSSWNESPKFTSVQSYNSNTTYSGFLDSFDGVHFFPDEEHPAMSQNNVATAGSSTIPFQWLSSKGQDWNEDDIMKKFELFKQFDTVEDHSDHHYTQRGSSVKQPPKTWAKKIQEEWKILEKDLPDTIYVRAYETRMDLLRAVIVGAEGTPYHDGLFFFDVFFPCDYPNVPPLVHYHSGGLRLNPNLYNCGKVCLSLLNTWNGSKNEKWIPGVSTMLQVLVSIQALILNAKPYFNEPGYERMSGSLSGEKKSEQYNERTFILSLKTMIYAMRRPPKHFEDFVLGHFFKRAQDILVACKAYMDGAQVGSLVKGGVQDVDEGDKSCSKSFKGSVAGQVKLLVQAFKEIGVKDCEKFLSPAAMGSESVDVTPNPATPCMITSNQF